MPVAIRHATPADLDACLAIYAPEVLEGTASFELEPPDLAEMRHRFDAVVGINSAWLVAEAEGEVAGYAYAGGYRARPAYRFTLEDSVYVARWARGQGLGRLLLDRLVLETASRGFRELIGIIGDSANTASIGLHLTCGFRHIGTLQKVGRKFDRWLDTVLTQRSLAG